MQPLPDTSEVRSLFLGIEMSFQLLKEDICRLEKKISGIMENFGG